MNSPDTLPETTNEARDLAIEWSHWMNDQNLSYGDMAEWGAFFTDCSDKFPELVDEFRENAII